MLSQRKLEPDEIEFNAQINAVFLSKQALSFEDAVRQYRRIESEFVKRGMNNEYRVVETRRRVTEWLLNHALQYGAPQEACREIWHELLQRGFSDLELRHTMSGIYVRCCQMNGAFDEGLAVVEPLIAEAEQALADATLEPKMRKFYEDDLAHRRTMQDELKAGIRE